MIDEARLATLVREAGETLEVPPGAAERVLAARDRAEGAHPGLRQAAARRRITWPRRPPHSRGDGGRRVRWAIAIAAVVVLVVAIAISANHPSSSTHSGAGATTTTVGPAVHSGSGGLSAGAAPSAGASSAPATTAPGGSTVSSLPTQVINTGSLSVRVPRGQVPATADRLRALDTGLGGYVADSTSSTSNANPTAALTLRVPAANFTSLVNQAEATGTVVSVSTSGRDVTAQVVNLQAQIQAAQATLGQFEQVLAKAQTIGDILAVEQQISSLQSQIDQLQGQEKVLDDQASYSTLTVTVSQPPAPAAVVPPPPHRSGLAKAWAHTRRSFTHGLEAVVGALGGLAVFFLCVGAIVAAAWGGWRLLRRRLV